MRRLVNRGDVARAAKPLGILALRLTVVLAALAVLASVHQDWLFATSRGRLGDAMRLWTLMVATGAIAGFLLEFIPPPRRIAVAWLPLIATVLVLGFLLYMTSLHGFVSRMSFPAGLRQVLGIFVVSQWASALLAVLLGILVGKSLKG